MYVHTIIIIPSVCDLDCQPTPFVHTVPTVVEASDVAVPLGGSGLVCCTEYLQSMALLRVSLGYDSRWYPLCETMLKS